MKTQTLLASLLAASLLAVPMVTADHDEPSLSVCETAYGEDADSQGAIPTTAPEPTGDDYNIDAKKCQFFDTLDLTEATAPSLLFFRATEASVGHSIQVYALDAGAENQDVLIFSGPIPISPVPGTTDAAIPLPAGVRYVVEVMGAPDDADDTLNGLGYQVWVI